MASAPDYVLTRDYADNNRINLQHYHWVELFGYLLHPQIPTNDQHLKVADVGTGTSIWLTQLSGRLPPSVSLDGLDVSFDATPPVDWLPPNMVLHHWNVREDVPQDLVERYDIVHVRHFCFVLRDNEIQSVLQRLMKLLKPGGYLQWAEADLASFRIEKTNPANVVDALSELMKVSQGQDPRLSPTWVPKLPGLFADGGLEMVQQDVREAPPYLSLAIHECILSIHELLVKKTGNETVAQELKRLVLEAAKETRAGSCWCFTRWIVIGRKPKV